MFSFLPKKKSARVQHYVANSWEFTVLLKSYAKRTSSKTASVAINPPNALWIGLFFRLFK